VPTVVLGVVFGFEALAKGNAANDKCDGNPDSCPAASYAEAKALNGAARTYRTASYWTVGIGGAASLVGAFLLVRPLIFPGKQQEGEMASRRENASKIDVLPMLGPGTSGVSVRTDW